MGGTAAKFGLLTPQQIFPFRKCEEQSVKWETIYRISAFFWIL